MNLYIELGDRYGNVAFTAAENLGRWIIRARLVDDGEGKTLEIIEPEIVRAKIGRVDLRVFPLGRVLNEKAVRVMTYEEWLELRETLRRET